MSTLRLADQSAGVADPESLLLPTLNIGRILRIAGLIALAFITIFTIWGFVAPLSKAAIAPGVVEVEGRRRTVQHLEGGIVSAILVKENIHVRKGQALMRLDTVQSGAAAVAARSQYFALLAEQRRIEAELNGGGAPKFDQELLDGGADAQAIIATQTALTASRRAALSGQVQILRANAAQAQAEISGIEPQITAQRAQLDLLRSELVTVRQLVDEQLERRSRLLELQRAVASAQGQIGSLTGQLLRTRRVMSETQARIAALTSGRRDEAQSRLRDIGMQLAEVQQRLKSTMDIDARRTIVAPVDGQVVQLRHTTVGGVVRAGEPLMDIVPDRQQFIVAARVRPIDIENVVVGLPTEIRLLPYSSRKVPMLMGHVTSVSEDAIVPDEPRAQPYYAVEIEIDDPDALKGMDVKLLSGMPTDSYIILGDRSLFSYLLQPLTDSFRRSFREN